MRRYIHEKHVLKKYVSYSTVTNGVRLASAGIIVTTASLLVAATAVTPIKPAISHDFAAPAVVDTGESYYAYSTESTYSGRRWHVPIQRADQLNGPWSPIGDAMPTAPGWAVRDAGGDTGVSAPEVAPTPDGWLLYFVARSAAANAQCIGTAIASAPSGPFRPTRAPLVCQPGGVDSIDPQSFIDDDGSRYLLYASGATRTTIWLQPTTPDGLRTVGAPSALISADRPDEHGIVEAPALIRHGGQYVLFYSGNTFDSGHYFENYATASTLAGPFRKHPGDLVNRASLGGRWPDTGGGTVVRGDPDQLVFHATTEPGVRSMFVAALGWDDDDNPTVDLDDGLTHRFAPTD